MMAATFYIDLFLIAASLIPQSFSFLDPTVNILSRPSKVGTPSNPDPRQRRATIIAASRCNL